ncbi:hypothetical protein AVEN_128986-1 [Araneus ventricosus]|uniref:Uncharacterized protein n=1 Tax=Araneus ventricosus TaxID=182803 RepID=A0A4Y2G9K2_ARAVE|nr:hypothetical protein AVEN_128986-1 [Araneus ventricosus]
METTWRNSKKKLSSDRSALINIANSLNEHTSLEKEDLRSKMETLEKTCSNLDLADAEFPAELRKIGNIEKNTSKPQPKLQKSNHDLNRNASTNSMNNSIQVQQ